MTGGKYLAIERGALDFEPNAFQPAAELHHVQPTHFPLIDRIRVNRSTLFDFNSWAQSLPAGPG